jgi:hypothetical protein
LNIHAFSLRRDHIGVLYSLDVAAPDGQASPVRVVLTDDQRREYAVVSHNLLGSELGVTGGLLLVEPLKDGAKTLTLTLDGMTVSSASGQEEIRALWSVTFIENMSPGAPIDYQLNSKVAPEVVSVGEVTLGKAGGAGIGFVKLLVDRGGAQTALYGRVSGKQAEALDAASYDEALQSEGMIDLPPPPNWPQPARAFNSAS